MQLLPFSLKLANCVFFERKLVLCVMLQFVALHKEEWGGGGDSWVHY